MNLRDRLQNAGMVQVPTKKPVSVVTLEQAGKVTESDTESNNFTVQSPFPQSNAELVKAIFGASGEMPEGAYAWHTSIAGVPGKVGWFGKPFNPASPVGLDGGELNRYFCLNVYRPDGEGQGRRETNFVYSVGVMLDDVGTKAKTPTLLPSMVVETSPGNFQWTYLFVQRVSDIGMLKGINGGLVAHGYCDPGSVSPTTRYQRLPFAVNCKTGEAIPCKLTSFNPERRYTPQQLIDGLGLDGVTASDAKAVDSGLPFDAESLTELFELTKGDIPTGYDETPADFGPIKANCAAVRWAVDNPEAVPEPYWRGLLGIVKFCADAEQLAHEVSGGHPDYDPDQTIEKLEGWTTGPTTCEYFSGFNALNGGACSSCPHANGGQQ